MKWPLGVCLAAMLLAGCRGAGQTTDPFFGRSTIEPPRTTAGSGARPPAYYSPTPATMPAPVSAPPVVSTPRVGVIGTPAISVPPAQTSAPTARPPRPTYSTPAPAYASSPSAAQPNQRLLPASGPLSAPNVIVPSHPSPWSSQTYASQPAPATQAPASRVTIPPPSLQPPPGPTTAPPLAPVGVQPELSTPVGPTLRPAASIPAPGLQGQCYPCYPCNPCYAPRACDPNSILAGRQRIVRPLQARECSPCPAGTVPVPCVPLYDPRRSGTSNGGAINLTDLPEPKQKT